MTSESADVMASLLAERAGQLDNRPVTAVEQEDEFAQICRTATELAASDPNITIVRLTRGVLDIRPTAAVRGSSVVAMEESCSHADVMRAAEEWAEDDVNATVSYETMQALVDCMHDRMETE